MSVLEPSLRHRCRDALSPQHLSTHFLQEHWPLPPAAVPTYAHLLGVCIVQIIPRSTINSSTCCSCLINLPMARDRSPPISIMHATVGVQTLQSLPIPLIPEVGKEFLKEQQQLQRDIFCKVYSALLDDVEALDKLLESKFSKEIIRIVSTIAASFRIDDELFIERLGLLGRKAKQPVAVDGLSGATVLDYLVNLMAEKSQYRGFQTLGRSSGSLVFKNSVRVNLQTLIADNKQAAIRID